MKPWLPMYEKLISGEEDAADENVSPHAADDVTPEMWGRGLIERVYGLEKAREIIAKHFRDEAADRRRLH